MLDPLFVLDQLVLFLELDLSLDYLAFDLVLFLEHLVLVLDYLELDLVLVLVLEQCIYL